MSVCIVYERIQLLLPMTQREGEDDQEAKPQFGAV